MGQLFYGTNAPPIRVPDHLLAHLKVIIAAKLRRNESFTLNWKHGPDTAPGRSSIWLQPAIPLRFVFDTETADQLDRGLLQTLSHQSNSNGGVSIDLADEQHGGTRPPVRPTDAAEAERALVGAA